MDNDDKGLDRQNFRAQTRVDRVSGGGRHQNRQSVHCGVRKAFRRLHVALAENDHDGHAPGRKGGTDLAREF
jgi:hypothetical protein